MNSGREPRSSKSFWSALMNFDYAPGNPESWVKLIAQVSIAGSAIMLVKALDGNVCGQPWNVWVPQTWMNPVGCFVRSLVQNVPDDFVSQPTAQPSPSSNTITPPEREGVSNGR